MKSATIITQESLLPNKLVRIKFKNCYCKTLVTYNLNLK